MVSVIQTISGQQTGASGTSTAVSATKRRLSMLDAILTAPAAPLTKQITFWQRRLDSRDNSQSNLLAANDQFFDAIGLSQRYQERLAA